MILEVVFQCAQLTMELHMAILVQSKECIIFTLSALVQLGIWNWNLGIRKYELELGLDLGHGTLKQILHFNPNHMNLKF